IDVAEMPVTDMAVLDGPEEDVEEKIALIDPSEDVEVAELPDELADELADDEEVAELADELADDEGEATVGEVTEGPAIVKVNSQGELVGIASATINGDPVPIEANITLVSGGVLLGKTVADEDGSFSFPNVVPGDYNVYGCAASYCGQRSCTVVSSGDCLDAVPVELDQVSVCGCDGYASAPAASFNGGVGGFGSGSSFSSGGFGGGGGWCG
ncbi:hypothetical protein N9Y42_11070, partial [Mariniblastus sp.]|nr:hypothetical protein [Mariniblastus sp.]